MIDRDILEQFGVVGEEVLLAGGQGTSVRVGDAVFKCVDDVLYYEYFASVWNSLNPQSYRIAKNIVSKNGSFVVNNFCATVYIDLLDECVPLSVKLEVSKKLHADLHHIDCSNLPVSHDPWSISHRTLWHNQELSANMHPTIYSHCNEILSSLPKLSEPCQLIHADLFGNIFYDQNHLPVVIDFSPAYVPVTYAHSILLADAIAYGDEPVTSVSLLEDFSHYSAHLQYAVAFRLLTQAHREPQDLVAFEKELDAYGKVVRF